MMVVESRQSNHSWHRSSALKFKELHGLRKLLLRHTSVVFMFLLIN